MTNPTCPHCGTAIGEHEANACLDKWVAETVMGWQWLPTPDPEGQHYCWVKDGCEIGEFEPSSDISAAWEVVEEMRRKAPSDTWFCVWNAWETNRWVAGYMEYDMDGDITWTDESADALAAPLAICRAAVLAAGEKP